MKIRPQVKPASRGADEGWAVLSTLISGFVIFGGIGWVLDRWWDTHLMAPIGVIVGMALSIYAVVMQFGRPDAQGRELHATIIAVADETAAAADLVRAKDSREPAVRVRGLHRHITADDGPGVAPLVRRLEDDLFR